MPTFCRHNRFLERCPICSLTLPGAEPERSARTPRAARTRAGGGSAAPASRRGARAEGLRVLRHERAVADGYSSSLVPGVHASADAQRLAGEIAFSAGRLRLLRSDPPDLYGEVRALAHTDVEAATRACFLIAYLSPAEGEEPFAAIRASIADAAALGELDAAQLGPRTSYDPARAEQTLAAYGRVVAQAGGADAAFGGDGAWTPARRFERVFERLALPGFTRTARYELLVLLGALGMQDVEADSLHVGGARGAATNDATMLAAKRIFAIGDPINLEHRAAALAAECALELGALELALWNFFSSERATLGFDSETRDDGAYAHARAALGL